MLIEQKFDYFGVLLPTKFFIGIFASVDGMEKCKIISGKNEWIEI